MTNNINQSLTEKHEKTVEKWVKLRELLAHKEPSLVQAHIANCRKDPVHFINTCITSYNPRESPSYHPLILFPKQVEYIRWLQDLEKNKEWGVVLKSRYTGASVVSCAYFLWRFIFDGDFKGGIGSNLARNVHTLGNIDSLFGKLEDMIARLPDYIRPRVLVKTMLIVNLQNGAMLTGDAGKNIGRSGRSTFFLEDEAAHIVYDTAAISALSENTDVCVLVSTPKGRANQFAAAWESEGYRKFKIHWRDDPRRTEAWYEQQKLKFDPHIVAQELDCSFTGSNESGLIQYQWIKAAQEAYRKYQPAHEDLLNYEIVAGYDPAGSGIRDKHVFTVRSGNRIILIDHWQNYIATDSAQRVIDLCIKHNVQKLNYDSGGGYGETLASMITTIEDLPFSSNAIDFGSSPTDREWDDGFKSRDKFANLRIEMYWYLRERLRKTYEHMVNGLEYEFEEMLLIPDHTQLELDLTQPTIEYIGGRKMKLMSKADMRAKGIKSPDFADSLALAAFEHDGGVWW